MLSLTSRSQILNSDLSSSFWLSIQMQHSLPPSCIARYVPDPSLLTYEEPNPTNPSITTTPSRRSISPPTTPKPIEETHRERSNSGTRKNGETESIRSEMAGKQVWYDEGSPRVTQKQKKAVTKQPRAKAAPKPNSKAAPKPRPKAPPKATGDGVEKPKPKRKQAAGGVAAQATKTKKGAATKGQGQT